MPRTLIAAITLAAWTLSAHAAPALRHIAIENGEGLEYVRTVPKPVTYRNVKALQLVAAADNDSVALVKDLDFKDGALEVDLAGLPGPGAANTARGFVGVAFRSAPHAAAFDCFYLRPTNGRADDQLRRNHSAQYVSEPDYGWERLRTQTPGVYESYVDLETGAWTHVKIEVNGVRARLFVNGAAQPSLIVNDLKRGVTSGAIGLWIGPGTEAYFRNLQITAN
ncbi:MAG TPA: family 16 glycoside hydrolase [Vicinamibacterales bacterium]|nr:family 16 glycoside hydrolase [Vicinamibacterales bacterium]